MRLTTVILIASLMQVSASTLAQRITLNQRNVNLETILKEIRKQTSYDFYYDRNVVQKTISIDVNVKNATVEETLEKILSALPLTYSIDGKLVSIKTKEPSFLDKIGEAFGNAKRNLSAIDIRGRIVSPDGQSIAGANVTVKGTKQSTISDQNGLFSLSGVDNNATLVISYIGYKTVEVSAKGQFEKYITLELSDNPLDEVQVIAYGTTSRRLSTGNIGTVKADVIEKQPVSNPLLALQGRVTGLVVTQMSGVPGGGVKVRIQGQNSMNAGNDPLYVVDGVPIGSQLPEMAGESLIFGSSGKVPVGSPNAAGNPLAFLNPNDIESIDILKDGDATAIYGSRAANGAILITTKKGHVGKTMVNVTFQNGWGKVPGYVELLNTRQYLNMRYEAFKNDGIDWHNSDVYAPDLKVWDTTRYTNWQKELLSGVTPYFSANGSISGGSRDMTYLVSVAYGKDGVPFPGDFGNTRTSLHFNLGSSAANRKLQFRFSGNYMNHDNKLPSLDPTTNALTLEPNAPNPYNSDGTINWAPDELGNTTFQVNPYKGLRTGQKNVTANIIGNLNVNYTIIPGLTISNNLGYNNTQTEQIGLSPNSVMSPEEVTNSGWQNSANYSNRNLLSWITEPQLTYKVNLGEGIFDFLFAGTISKSKAKVSNVRGVNYNDDNMLENLGSATSIADFTSVNTNQKYAAVFGRLNYNFQNRYIINVSARRDGSSKFGVNSRFKVFSAVGAAWIFSTTKFIQSTLPWISLGKLRASYGTTGNDQIPDFQYVTRYGQLFAQLPYQNIFALVPNNLPNPNLQWELTKKFSVGFDFGFFKDRITLTANYASNTSDNQLSNYKLPGITGFTSFYSNFPGTVRNTTYEASMTSQNIKKKNFEWSTSLNLSVAKNKLLSFPDLASSSYANDYVIGMPLNITRIALYAGLDSNTGLYQFFDKEGKTTKDPLYPTDWGKVVNLDPVWYGGINNQIRLGRFSIDFFLQLVKQNGFNPTLGNGGVITPGSFSPGLSNQPVAVMNRWRMVGDQASVKKFSSSSNDVNASTGYFSTAAFTDASFARLKNVSASWLLPTPWITKSGLQSIRVFANAQNLWTITKYKGLDPEVPIATPLLPPMRVVSLGAQVTF